MLLRYIIEVFFAVVFQVQCSLQSAKHSSLYPIHNTHTHTHTHKLTDLKAIAKKRSFEYFPSEVMLTLAFAETDSLE